MKKFLKTHGSHLITPSLIALSFLSPVWGYILVGWLVLANLICLVCIAFFEYLRKIMSNMDEFSRKNLEKEEKELLKALNSVHKFKYIDAVNICYILFFLSVGWFWTAGLYICLTVIIRSYLWNYKLPA